MLVAPIIDRIVERVKVLAHRVEGAAELAALVKTGNLPQQTPAAFVLPLALRGSQPDASAGIFRQFVNEVVAVILVVAAPGDATGGSALPTLDELIGQIVEAVVGWAPGDQVGVFELQAGNLVAMPVGTVMYQLNFAIADQLRIDT